MSSFVVYEADDPDHPDNRGAAQMGVGIELTRYPHDGPAYRDHVKWITDRYPGAFSAPSVEVLPGSELLDNWSARGRLAIGDGTNFDIHGRVAGLTDHEVIKGGAAGEDELFPRLGETEEDFQTRQEETQLWLNGHSKPFLDDVRKANPGLLPDA